VKGRRDMSGWKETICDMMGLLGMVRLGNEIGLFATESRQDEVVKKQRIVNCLGMIQNEQNLETALRDKRLVKEMFHDGEMKSRG
jgi:hypothetical protein